MFKHLLLGAVANALLFGSLAASAQDRPFYLHGTIGEGTIEDSRFVDDDNDTALGLRFGWRFLPWLAVEAGYGQLGDYQPNCGGEICPAVVFPELEYESIELGLNARVPFGETPMFGVARVGVHEFDVGFGGSETEPYYGIGFGYAFNDRFSVSLDWDRYETGVSRFNVDRLGLGLEVAF
ncbi:MAG: outer membrane beta-barrel protein [Pseudomarimonas sp.]